VQHTHHFHLCALVLTLTFAHPCPGAPLYQPLPQGASGTTYRNIPFEFGREAGVSRGQWATPNQIDTIATFPPVHASTVHILASMGWAEWVPQNTTVGEIRAYYADGGFSALDLVAGVNISDWAWDRPGQQSNLPHARAEVGYSFTTAIDFSTTYEGHRYYSSFALDGTRLVDHLELRLTDAMWNDNSHSLGLNVVASTAEIVAVPEPHAATLGLLGSLTALVIGSLAKARDYARRGLNTARHAPTTLEGA
jgi:hypothetical protein